MKRLEIVDFKSRTIGVNKEEQAESLSAVSKSAAQTQVFTNNLATRSCNAIVAVDKYHCWERSTNIANSCSEDLLQTDTTCQENKYEDNLVTKYLHDKNSRGIHFGAVDARNQQTEPRLCNNA
eukprot:2284422-Amphidinium_carterae.1